MKRIRPYLMLMIVAVRVMIFALKSNRWVDKMERAKRSAAIRAGKGET